MKKAPAKMKKKSMAKMKKGPMKITAKQEKTLNPALVAEIKKTEKSDVAMKTDSMAMIKKSVAMMKKASALKMKMKKKK